MDGLRNLFLVGAGGALGSMLRYLISTLLVKGAYGGFPWRTLVVNLAGSIALAWLLRGGLLSVSEQTRLFLGVGLLGGFTTYSTFNYEVVELVRHGHMGQAAAYVATTVIVAFAAAMIIIESPA
ncbi:MAG: fluoride efflux transporter CrcB [Acidobacteria bacterium]|nr:fluoride efflux transporter CrcB [Acidobacteriota bacterium]